jgi:hypothetical protein
MAWVLSARHLCPALGSIGSVLCKSVVSSPFDDSISQEGP